MKLFYKNPHGVLYHGDCLEVMDFIALEGSHVDLILADPPYGTTNNKWDSVIPLDFMWGKANKIAQPNTPIVMTSQTPFDKVLGVSNLRNLKYEWVWKKTTGTGFLNAKKMPLKVHENALVFYKRLPTYNPQKTQGKPYTVRNGATTQSKNYGGYHSATTECPDGRRFPVDVVEFKYDKNKIHPTQKPVALFEYFIKTYTNPKATVLDFCAGSGTTAVAAQRCGRKWILVEKEKEYCKKIVERLEGLDGGLL